MSIPANTSASIRIPLKAGQKIMESGRDLGLSEDLRVIAHEKDYCLLDAGSGDYLFRVEDEPGKSLAPVEGQVPYSR
ncbi:hypothetical protein N6H14_25645 [Paenibacillus sp. CC-CFT747]|nr:hypothetical protein N6H14_25645 [Paenibacillus sp. CC-CFT747]